MTTRTPLAFMSQEDGKLSSLGQYFAIGSCAILSMDVLDSLPHDWDMLTRKKMTQMTVVYIISRIAAWIFILLVCLLLVAPIQACSQVHRTVTCLYIVTRASTTLLFFVRVIAVYPGNRLVKTTFIVLWLISLSGATLSLFTTTAIRISTTPYCVPVLVGQYWQFLITAGSEVLYDLMVCVAVTYKVYSQAEANAYAGWRWRIFNIRQPSFTQRFLWDSHAYFILTACMKIPGMIIVIVFATVIPSSPGAQLLLVFPDAAVTNILAAKIYRNMRLRKRGLLGLDHSNATNSAFIELSPITDRRARSSSRRHVVVLPESHLHLTTERWKL